jgi:hypothetical protein
MPDRATRKIALLIGLAALVAPSRAAAQTASAFQGATLEVVSEWTGQDRGDGSGSYRLTTRVTDSRAGMTIQHQLAADRNVRLEVESSESLSVYEGDSETAHAESDPTALGVWAEPAIAYAIPFDVEFSSEARKSYRPRDRQVEELVHSAAPDARISTRAASDGRTMAVVEIPGVLPVADLARMFVGIRQAFADADVGLAKLQIKGQADASASVEAAAAQ